MTQNFNISPYMFKLAAYIFVIALIVNFSCNKTGNLGTDLLSDDWIYAQGTDYHNLKLSSIAEDSVIFSAAGFPGTFYIGNVTDPIFGKYESEFYTQLNFGITKDVEFLSSTVDSVVLSIRYDSSNFYGEREALQTVRVYPLIDTLHLDKTYYKDMLKHMYVKDELGKLENFKPNLKDTVKILHDTIPVSYSPQLRIHLDTNKFMSILRKMDDTSFNDLVAFNSAFPGVAIVAEGTQSLIAINPSVTESGITIYYTTVDKKKARFNFFFGSARVANNRIDNVNTTVEPFIKNQIGGDSICYLQGFCGNSLRIQIPYDNSWDGKLINYAVLELYSPDVMGDNIRNFSRPSGLFIRDLAKGKPYLNIVDLSYALQSDLALYFGGNLSKTTLGAEEVAVYRFNITGHFINSKKLKKEIDLLISPVSKAQRPSRLILGGQANSKYGAKLKIVFSEK